MKKSSLVVALPALVLSGLLLSGCGMFRSHKAWETARQEAPLEIPPGLDTPPASDALVIPPPGANNPTAAGVTADVGGAAGVIADGFTLSDTVDNTYRRVGNAITAANLGEVVAHDDAAHSFTLNVNASAAKKRGFFGRLFHRGSNSDEAATGNGPRQVQVTVNGSGTSASEVRAQGPAAAVAKVIDGLKSKLGG